MSALPIELVREVFEQFESDPEIRACHWLPLVACCKTFNAVSLPFRYKCISVTHFSITPFTRTIKQKPQYAQFVKKVDWLIDVKPDPGFGETQLQYNSTKHYGQLTDGLNLLGHLNTIQALSIRLSVTLPSPGSLESVNAFDIPFLPTPEHLLRSMALVSFSRLTDISYNCSPSPRPSYQHRYSPQVPWRSLQSVVLLASKSDSDLLHAPSTAQQDLIPYFSSSNLSRLAITNLLEEDVRTEGLGDLIRSCRCLTDLTLDFRPDGSTPYSWLIDFVLRREPMQHIVKLTLVAIDGRDRHPSVLPLCAIFPKLEIFHLTPLRGLDNIIATMFPPSTAYKTLERLYLACPRADFRSRTSIQPSLSNFADFQSYPNLRTFSLICFSPKVDYDAGVRTPKMQYLDLVEDLTTLASGAPDQLELSYHFERVSGVAGRQVKSLHARGGGEVQSAWWIDLPGQE